MCRIARTLRPIAGAALLGALFVAPATAQDLWVYQESLAAGWADWSWATHDLAATGIVHSAPNAIEWQPDGWQGIYFHSSSVFDAGSYLSLRFWVRGIGGSSQHVNVVVQFQGDARFTVDLDDHVTGGAISSTQWREVVIDLAAVGFPDGSFNELILQDASGGDQPAVRVDDIRFVFDPTPPPPPPTIAVAVDPALDRRAISDLVYGVNFASAAQLADVGYPLNRWGGNRTTRYNWQLDVDNSAGDWFFTNYTGSGDEGQLPETSGADQFLLANRAAGAESLLTLPTIGRVAGPDRERRWGFSEALYGPQLLDECRYFPSPPAWCNPDAGNGRCNPVQNPLHCNPDGRIVGNDPDDTTVAVAPSFLGDWVAFAASRVGPAEAGGLRFVALDNEPMLWNSTHADIHPAPPTYDEVWNKGLAVANAAKAADPGIAVLGPDTWGWCDLWTSAADAAAGPSCLEGPDRQAHGGLPFIAWVLSRSCAEEVATGVRPIDYVDVHYYPQSGEAFGGEGFAALRLQSIRELWDPTYTSQSWIGDEVYLLPRLQAWIDSYCPGTRIALTEYSWGDDAAPSGALAQAEVLAILGREGVGLATRWVVPASGSKTEEAFRLFLDYDGAGSSVLGDRVRAVSADPQTLGAYAVRGHSDEIYLLLFNKSTSSREAAVSVTLPVAGGYELYRFDAASALGWAGTATPSSGVLSLTLPGRSATLAVGRLVSDLIFQDRFETATTNGWSRRQP
ncbi:MAG: glycoside hydrolase family 44 protein [Thermoanaerobaculia bacterium]